MKKNVMTLANKIKLHAYEKIFKEKRGKERDLYVVMDEWASVILEDIDKFEKRKEGGVSLGVGESADVEKNEDTGRMISYLVSYKTLVNYFRVLSGMDRDQIIAGIFMVYGWMPKVLRFNCGETLKDEELAEVHDFLLSLQRCGLSEALDLLDEDGMRSLEKVKRITNNSVVGMSKLLHFINPTVFPMYDSNIGEVFGGFSDVTSYVGYVKGFNEICSEFAVDVSKFAKSERITNLRRKCCCDEKFIWSYVRLVELVLFRMGKNLKREKEKRKRGRGET